MPSHVFVDRTGRRRRAFVLIGAGVGVLLVVSVIVLLAGLVTGAPLPVPGWPDSAQQQEEPVVTKPSPSSTARTTPGPVRTTRPPTTPSPIATTPTSTPTRPGNGQGHGRPTKSPGKP